MTTASWQGGGPDGTSTGQRVRQFLLKPRRCDSPSVWVQLGKLSTLCVLDPELGPAHAYYGSVLSLDPDRGPQEATNDDLRGGDFEPGAPAPEEASSDDSGANGPSLELVEPQAVGPDQDHTESDQPDDRHGDQQRMLSRFDDTHLFHEASIGCIRCIRCTRPNPPDAASLSTLTIGMIGAASPLDLAYRQPVEERHLGAAGSRTMSYRPSE